MQGGNCGENTLSHTDIGGSFVVCSHIYAFDVQNFEDKRVSNFFSRVRHNDIHPHRKVVARTLTVGPAPDARPKYPQIRRREDVIYSQSKVGCVVGFETFDGDIARGDVLAVDRGIVEQELTHRVAERVALIRVGVEIAEDDK